MYTAEDRSLLLLSCCMRADEGHKLVHTCVLQALTDLHVDFTGVHGGGLKAEDWRFLRTFPALRALTLTVLHGVDAGLAEVLLALPHLQTLEFGNLYGWRSTAAAFGQLRARLAVARPHCNVYAWELGSDD